MGFVQKLEILLTVLIVGYLVKFPGFDPTLPAQPDAVISRLPWLDNTPNIVFTFVTLLVAMRFTLDEHAMGDVRRLLDERRASDGRLKSDDLDAESTRTVVVTKVIRTEDD